MRNNKREQIEKEVERKFSKKDRQKTMKEVKEVRTDLWSTALKKAKNKSSDAYEIYCDLCSFD